MKPLIGQLRWLMATLCVLAIFSTFVVSVGYRASTESEIVEIEELEILAIRRVTERVCRKCGTDKRFKSSLKTTTISRVAAPEVTRTERSRFNGIGTYLLA